MSANININEKAALIWSIADKLTGAYKPHEYGEVILPMTVLRRFDCVLADTKKQVVEKSLTLDTKNKSSYHVLKNTAGRSFYNTSKYDFQTLLNDADNIEANFRSYINSFSENVQDIIKCFEFDKEISKMADKNLLYLVIKEFTADNANLHPDKVSNIEMGYIFEEIIRRFSESYKEDAGQHYTPREVIELMVNILFAEESLSTKATKTLYDPACGTGGMLSVASEHLRNMSSAVKLLCFGQEYNDKTFAVCQSDMLIKNDEADNIKKGDTLSDDKFTEEKFDFILSNPPFGREWKVQKAAVEKEAKKGFAGRFGAGLPAIRDSQLLFLQTAIAKMNPKGSRIAIIHNGSPLFSGDAGSGESEIRRYVIENDLLEAIIALPNDIFYNTGITTYIWVLSNKKASVRAGKVQLINANEMYKKRRKSLGNKRNDIPPHAIEQITRIYGEFKENEVCKIFDNESFGYHKIIVERPLKDEEGNLILKSGKKQPDTSLRDSENIPLTEDIEEYFKREVLPYASDAWIDNKKTKIGYEIPFTRYFYKYQPPRPTSEIMREILELEKELDGSIKEIFEP